jgi:hypothetical protein
MDVEGCPDRHILQFGNGSRTRVSDNRQMTAAPETVFEAGLKERVRTCRIHGGYGGQIYHKVDIVIVTCFVKRIFQKCSGVPIHRADDGTDRCIAQVPA